MAAVNEIRVAIGDSLMDRRDLTESEADRAAEAVLERAGPSSEFIGIDHTGERGVYFEARGWCIRFVPFDADGLDEVAGERIDIDEEWDADRFLRKHGPGSFLWVHPRYRWLFGEEASPPPV